MVVVIIAAIKEKVGAIWRQHEHTFLSENLKMTMIMEFDIL